MPHPKAKRNLKIRDESWERLLVLRVRGRFRSMDDLVLALLDIGEAQLLHEAEGMPDGAPLRRARCR